MILESSTFDNIIFKKLQRNHMNFSPEQRNRKSELEQSYGLVAD